MTPEQSARLTILIHKAEAALREARHLVEHAPDRPGNTLLAHIEALRALSAVSRLECSLKLDAQAMSPKATVRGMLSSVADLDTRDRLGR